MNPFPDTILTPSTAHRIPSTSGALDLVNKLLGHEINATGFLMDEDLITAAEAKGFSNDIDRAIADLLDQLPDAVREAIFPPPPPPVPLVTSLPDGSSGSSDNDDDDDGSGMGSGLSIGMGSPGSESLAIKRRREEEEQQRRRGPSLGM